MDDSYSGQISFSCRLIKEKFTLRSVFEPKNLQIDSGNGDSYCVLQTGRMTFDVLQDEQFFIQAVADKHRGDKLVRVCDQAGDELLNFEISFFRCRINCSGGNYPLPNFFVPRIDYFSLEYKRWQLAFGFVSNFSVTEDCLAFGVAVTAYLYQYSRYYR